MPVVPAPIATTVPTMGPHVRRGRSFDLWSAVRRTVVRSLACFLVAVVVGGWAGEPASAAVHHPAPGASLSASGPVLLSGGTCPSSALKGRVTLSRAVLLKGQDLSVAATITNIGTTPCAYSGRPAGAQS